MEIIFYRNIRRCDISFLFRRSYRSQRGEKSREGENYFLSDYGREKYVNSDIWEFLRYSAPLYRSGCRDRPLISRFLSYNAKRAAVRPSLNYLVNLRRYENAPFKATYRAAISEINLKLNATSPCSTEIYTRSDVGRGRAPVIRFRRETNVVRTTELCLSRFLFALLLRWYY